MTPGKSPHTYYSSEIADFLSAGAAHVVGELTLASGGSVLDTQRDAWLAEVVILKRALADVEGTLFLEFDVPRVGSRIDAVVIAGAAVVPIEFKVGEAAFRRADIYQAWDYALDLKNFHRASHDIPIVPILVATDAPPIEPTRRSPAPDLVYSPILTNADQLAAAIRLALSFGQGPEIDARAWGRAPYRPTPTIVEAARALYASHSVDAIARNDADTQNLGVTSKRVEAVIEEAQRTKSKAIVFVTGVPGAGKTLVGLDIATRRGGSTPTHAVYLSGNGPLVKVLTEALTVDEQHRLATAGKKVRKGPIQQKVKAFIQNVHHFRDAGLRDDQPPADHVVIFDEAQRAWDQPMTADFMRRKKGRPGFTQSEPEFLLSYLDRHEDWAVVVCLVGGGQEINRGEAGIAAWLEAVERHFANWSAHLSPNLADSEYAAGHAIQSLGQTVRVCSDESLHLSVSMRSFRAEHVSKFVKSVLDHDSAEAGSLLDQFRKKYPLALTRSLRTAKDWLQAHARGSERFGLVASSKAKRLKPDAIDIRYEVDPVHWFLRDRDDVRSSFYLEDAATEFQVQGLELDWACVAWDADFRFVAPAWSCHKFGSDRWNLVRKSQNQQYLRNAYRVLLTRARQGMVIYVPPGNPADSTRLPSFYDGTFSYLQGLGLEVI